LKSESDNEELVKRFLLDDLSEPERAEVEDRFLARDDLFEELLLGEDDLIDAYAGDELPATEREIFERRFMATPRGRRRVEFAGALFNSISARQENVTAAAAASTTPTLEEATATSRRRSLLDNLFGRRPALGFAPAAALLLVILGGLWLLLERTRTRSAPQEEQAEQPRTIVEPRESPPPQTAAAPEEPLPREKETPKSAPSRETPKGSVPVVAAFTLLPGTVRGGGDSNSIVLQARTTEVHLRLVLDGEFYGRYRATLSTVEGRKLWSRIVSGKASIKSGPLSLSLPGELLKNGDYVLELGGANAGSDWESVADYSFRIIRK
jgi:hypothetical protein